jgi:hypothetical protein
MTRHTPTCCAGALAGHRRQRGGCHFPLLSYRQNASPGYMCGRCLKHATEVCLRDTGGREVVATSLCFLINQMHRLGICACVTSNAPRRCACWAQEAERWLPLPSAFLSTKRIAWVYVHVLPQTRHGGVLAGQGGQRGSRHFPLLFYQRNALPGYMCMCYLKRATEVCLMGTGGKEVVATSLCFLINETHCLCTFECVT